MKIKDEYIVPYLIHHVNIINNIGNRTELTLSNYPYYRDRGFKAILRPFSDLTKEISVNGETFIPIYKLFELEYKGTIHFENVRKMYFEECGRFISSSHIGTAMSTYINVLEPKLNNYWKIQKLHEWHFDTNALINENLAIDINSNFLTEC